MVDLLTAAFTAWADWLESWPLLLRVVVIVTVGPVMLLHFLAWVGSLAQRWANRPDNVVPFRRRGGNDGR